MKIHCAPVMAELKAAGYKVALTGDEASAKLTVPPGRLTSSEPFHGFELQAVVKRSSLRNRRTFFSRLFSGIRAEAFSRGNSQ